MNRRGAIALACLLLMSAALAAQARPLFMVTNTNDDNLQVFDANTYESVAIIKTDEGPTEVIVSSDGVYAYVSNYDGGDSSVDVIDLEDLERINSISILPYWRPRGIALTKDGKKLYVQAVGSRTTLELDAYTGEVLRKFKLNEINSFFCALSPDESLLFVSNAKQGNISVLDLEVGDLMRNVISGRFCEGLAVTPDGKELWVATRNSGTIAIIETNTMTRTAVIKQAGYPVRLEFTSDGSQAWVTCAVSGQLVGIDVKAREVVKRIHTGDLPIGLAVEPEGKRVFVANQNDGEVVVVDRDKMEIVNTIEVGSKPSGMAFSRGR